MTTYAARWEAKEREALVLKRMEKAEIIAAGSLAHIRLRAMKRVQVLVVAMLLAASLICALFYFIPSASDPWLHQAHGQIAVSFVALAVVSSLLFITVPRLKVVGRKFPVPREIKDIALLGFIASTIIFAVFGFLTATSQYISSSHAALMAFYVAYPVGHFIFGVFGLAFLVSASLCLMVYFLDRGKLRAFRDALRFFVFPALVVFELGLLFVDAKEMPLHVMMILGGTPLAHILTNWFVLVVSSGLFALGLAESLFL